MGFFFLLFLKFADYHNGFILFFQMHCTFLVKTLFSALFSNNNDTNSFNDSKEIFAVNFVLSKSGVSNSK